MMRCWTVSSLERSAGLLNVRESEELLGGNLLGFCWGRCWLEGNGDGSGEVFQTE